MGRTPPFDDALVMIISGTPPGSRGVDRLIPWATPEGERLLEASRALIERGPSQFPIAGALSVGLTLRTATEFDDDEREPLIVDVESVLLHAGVLADESVVSWDAFEIEPTLTDGYSIEINYEPDEEQV
jgi:hypothetical protein